MLVTKKTVLACERVCVRARVYVHTYVVAARVWASFVCYGLVLALVGMGLGPRAANAAEQRETRPSVLVVDANTGDLEALTHAWLGDNTTLIAEDNGHVLLSSNKPTWWTAGGTDSAPATFVLGATSNAAIESNHIAWALDSIAQAGYEQRSFVISMGVTGMSLRTYAEDLGSPLQSERADIVGLAFCGVPQLGYTAQDTYPDLALWDILAASAGIPATSLARGSEYLARLNSGSFPAVSKTLSVSGVVGDLGFGTGDGAATLTDLALPPSVADQVMPAQVTATAGQAIGLSRYWLPFSSEIDYSGRAVDHNLAERLSAMTPYATSLEVQEHAREFYDAWFAAGAPVTHNSSLIAIDLSGSMLDAIEPGITKLDAAKVAAVGYLRAMQALEELPQAAPMDVHIIGFGETLVEVAGSYDDASCTRVESMSAAAYSETNIGIALDEALASLDHTPTCAKRHILLLSDGATTRGKTNEQMMSTSIKNATDRDIVIDVVGFGDVGESNSTFLRQVSDATGGTYYEARDSYELRRDFLKAYYGSLGLELTEYELDEVNDDVDIIAVADSHTSALQVGIVCEGKAPEVQLLCDDNQVDASSYELHERDGLVSLQCKNPRAGNYSLELSGGVGRAHVFAVRQLGIGNGRNVDGEKLDPSFALLVAAGVALMIGLVVVTIMTRKRASADRS